MNFGLRFKQLRKEKNLTQAEIANIFSLGESTISFYESNKRTPDYALLQKIADFFDVTTDYLLGRSEIKNPYGRDASAVMETNLGSKYYLLDKSGLPEEAVEQIDEYVEFIKQKYDSSENSRKKGTKK
ncbi:helix-turn-helix domain-containing protein [Geosporobacter ferrireducens]|uniref:HTH cro/C1-type domain-containing protein n=1 Tax=Geosporobacter ferrireducens TaxID=1424294 RepID=A0A1D8GKT2_9FIRM|nr:helix-turn-helix domain-containing protein [Geosporobacter ferrireducens]AOT71503.1 hypothetical protein Gferi_19390 [Geosporobacter ferrireducens]MTI57816.1 helix-turn-helix domain-containing protein [Geosporobacter ferrireducens]